MSVAMDSNLATAIRTTVVLLFAWALALTLGRLTLNNKTRGLVCWKQVTNATSPVKDNKVVRVNPGFATKYTPVEA